MSNPLSFDHKYSTHKVHILIYLVGDVKKMSAKLQSETERIGGSRMLSLRQISISQRVTKKERTGGSRMLDQTKVAKLDTVVREIFDHGIHENETLQKRNI